MESEEVSDVLDRVRSKGGERRHGGVFDERSFWDILKIA